MGDLMTHFSAVTDTRKEQGKRHQLISIIAIAIIGVICRADDRVSIEEVGKAKEDWFRKFLDLPHGIASHGTFGKVFARMDPDEFQACFLAWIKDIAEMTTGQVIAIDGKTVRRSHDRANGQKPLHLVSAWASANELAIGRISVDNSIAGPLSIHCVQDATRSSQPLESPPIIVFDTHSVLRYYSSA